MYFQPTTRRIDLRPSERGGVLGARPRHEAAAIRTRVPPEPSYPEGGHERHGGTMNHEPHIRAAHAAAVRAGQAGNHPFGAVLVRNGRRILTAENTVNTEQDVMGHAEYNLVRDGVRSLSQATLRCSTLYASTAPCLLCTAAILLAEIPRIVYSVSYDTFAKLVPGEYRYIACEEVVQRLDRDVEVVGPVLEREGLHVFQYWEGEHIPLDRILRLTGDADG